MSCCKTSLAAAWGSIFGGSLMSAYFIKRHFLMAAIVGLLPSLLMASPRYDIEEPTVAAIVNGESISLTVIELMHAVAVKRRPETTRVEVMASMIEDRLLARQALASYPIDQLIEKTRVGYAPAIQIEESLVANLQAAFGPRISAAVRAEKGGNLNGIVIRRQPVTEADWRAVLGVKPRLLLEYMLDDNGRKEAAGRVLMAYRLGDQVGQVTLLDVYDAQHVQGRNRLHNRDAAFAMQQAELLLERRYVLHWARNRSGLSAEDYQVFVRAVEDRLVRDGWTSLIGITADMHDDNAHLKQLAAAVTRDEVAEYYEKNRDQFRRIERVKASHIRTRDFESANRVYSRLQKGEDFASVARQLSVAEDREQGGELGWIEHGEKNASWIESIAFVQKPGTTSKPFRSPGPPGAAAVWEILRVDERIEGYQPLDSESVRYGAAQALSRKKAQAEYRSIRERVLDEAEIRMNPVFLESSRKVAP